MFRSQRARRAVVLGGVVLAILSLLAMLLAPGAAMAHESLTGSTPKDGEQLAVAPERVLLQFSGEPAGLGLVVEVAGPDGDVTQGKPSLEGSEVAQALSPELPAGAYAVTWRVTSSDGHPISGTLGFTVTEGAAQTDATEDQDQTAPATAPPPPTDFQTGPAPQPDQVGQPARVGGDEDGGLPGWAWAAAAVGLLALAGAVVAARRSR